MKIILKICDVDLQQRSKIKGSLAFGKGLTISVAKIEAHGNDKNSSMVKITKMIKRKKQNSGRG